MLNLLLNALGAVCQTRRLERKILLAPSLRAGYQWLDQLTRAKAPVFNVHVFTLRHLVLELAAPQTQARGGVFLSGRRLEVLSAQLLGRLQAQPSGYLSGLEPSLSLIRALQSTLQELRLAGLTAADLDGKHQGFEDSIKAQELIRLLAEYEQMLGKRRLVDYAEALRIAGNQTGFWHSKENPLALLPQDLEQALQGLELSFWQSIPEQHKRVIPIDQPGQAQQDDGAPSADNAREAFRAVGEINEIRQIFRQCLELRRPWDEVEIITTDRETYVPLIYELAAELAPERAEPAVTFFDGLPVRVSRPGRAFIAWLEWVREGFPQSVVVRMIGDGLLEPPLAADQTAAVGFTQLAGILRSLAIGAGRDRYLAVLDRQISACLQQDDGPALEDEVPAPRASTQWLTGLQTLRPIIEALLASAPQEPQPAAILKGVRFFLSECVHCPSKLDRYSCESLLRQVQDLLDCVATEAELGLDLWEWLEALPKEVRVEGEGPRPGCLFVTSLS